MAGEGIIGLIGGVVALIIFLFVIGLVVHGGVAMVHGTADATHSDPHAGPLGFLVEIGEFIDGLFHAVMGIMGFNLEG